MAARLKLPFDRYIRYERGYVEVPERVMLLSRCSLLQLEEHERYYLLRRRRGWSQAELAVRLRRSKRWIILMETGRAPVEELRRYWRGRS